MYKLTNQSLQLSGKLRNLTGKPVKLSDDLGRVKDELKKLSDNLEDLSGEQKKPRNKWDEFREDLHALNEALIIKVGLPW